MKPTPIVAVIAVLLASQLVGAGEPQLILLPQDQEIRLALEAGPEHLRADATVYVFGKNGYSKIRSGTNGFTCLVNRDGNQHGDNDLKPTCWDAEGTRTIVPVMLRVGELLARFASAEEIQRDIEAGFASGKFASPHKAGIAYMLRGDLRFDPATRLIAKTLFPPHFMIYAPGVSNADIGAPEHSTASPFALPAVYTGYSGGTHTGYIIVLAAPNAEHSH